MSHPSQKFDCANIITIRSTKPTLSKIIKFLEGDSGVFDFNRLCPMPTELADIELFAIGTTDYYYFRDAFKASGNELLTIEWVMENCIDLFTLRRLKKQYGFLSRHDWCVKNWGVMVNAQNSNYVVNDKDDDRFCELVYCFDTVWSEPQQIYDLLFVYLQSLQQPAHFEWYFKDSGQNYEGYMEPSGHIAGLDT